MILDTGALIAFERGKQRIAALLDEASFDDSPIVVPTVVLAEAWRGGRRTARLAMLLRAVRVEPLHDAVARRAGEALAAVKSATTIDAIVVSCADALGLPLVTSDVDDMKRLADHFGGVALIAV